MNDSVELEFHPYFGECVKEDFKYDLTHQPIIDFFNKEAKECIEQLISKAFVIKANGDVVGYVAISFKSVERKVLTRKKQRGKYDRPVLVIGQLIFDSNCQKKGYGTRTIQWVISLVRLVQKFLPLRLLFVDAIDDEAANYYKKRGFQPLKDDPHTLVLDLLPLLKNS